MAVDREKVVQAALKYAEKKRYDRAIAEYQRILAEDPNDARILLKVAELQTKGEMYPAAVETYERVGKLYSQQGFAQKAVAVYNQLRELLTRHAPHLEDRYTNVLLELAKLHQQLGHVADAIFIWEQIATKHQKSGRELDAAEAFKKLVELDGNNPLHRLRLAETLAKSRNIEGAIGQFRAAAELLLQLGHLDNALKVYDRLLQIRPEPAVAKQAAMLHLERNQGNDAMLALAKLEIAFKANQKDLETLAMLARSFEQLNQPTKAIEVYKEQVRLAREQNNKDARKEALRRAAALAPHDEKVKQLVRENLTSSIPAPMPKPEPDADVMIEGQEEVFLEEDFESVDDIADLEIEEDPIPPVRSPAIPPPPTQPTLSAPPATRVPPAAPVVPVRPSANLRLGDMDEPQPPRSLKVVEVPPSLRVVQDARGESDLDEISLEQETLTEVASFRRARQPARAIECLRIALEVIPASIPLREQLRDLLLETGDQEGAIGEMISLATLFISQGDTEAASAALHEVLLLSPNHQRARELLNSLDYGGLEPVEEDGLSDDGAGTLPGSELEFDEEAILAPTSVASTRAFDLEDDPFGGVPFEQVASYRPPRTAPPIQDDRTPPEPIALELDEPTAPEPTAAPEAHELEFDEEPSFETSIPPPAPPLVSGPQVIEEAEETDVFTSASRKPNVTPVTSPQDDQEVSRELEFEPPRGATAMSLGFQGDTVEAVLEEADFFASRGLYEDARAIVEEQLGRTPNHPILLERLRELEEAQQAAEQSAASMTYEAAPQTINSELLDASLDALDSFEPTQEAHGYFHRGDEQVDIESVFAKFKEGVKAQVEDSDSATHYDLGVAYKEMNLLQDAISEFLLASQDPSRACVCLSMVGMIELERDNQEAAIDAFQRALQAPEKTAEQELSLFYELGQLYQQRGEKGTALDYYKKIHRRDPDFRDVAERIAALEPKRPAMRKLESEDDLDLIFDDILGGGKGL
ncbi:MAG: tetratricopeptide repeat protein [Myxococcales bacterium]|nr:tetratricopeptide repeat protein [Polyangiaceae bacterium]MDW8249335.1 tetratricopeptide repeat protein [Myxococcales bacterium]